MKPINRNDTRGRCINCGGPSRRANTRCHDCWVQDRRARALSVEERFWSKVDASGDCWQWTGTWGRAGYGQFAIRPGVSRIAHRFAWELLIGPIPQGLQIDHLCRNIRCVNPDHLEVVTSGVNSLRGYGPAALNARKTHCLRGHELSGDNLYLDPRGARICRICSRSRLQARRLAAKGVAA